MVPPTSIAMTSTIGSLPHFRHIEDASYGSSVTEVILVKGGIPVSFKVSSEQVNSDAFDIVVVGHGVYLTTGTYSWIIKATGYKVATVSVNVVNQAP